MAIFYCMLSHVPKTSALIQLQIISWLLRGTSTSRSHRSPHPDPAEVLALGGQGLHRHGDNKGTSHSLGSLAFCPTSNSSLLQQNQPTSCVCTANSDENKENLEIFKVRALMFFKSNLTLHGRTLVPVRRSELLPGKRASDLGP